MTRIALTVQAEPGHAGARTSARGDDRGGLDVVLNKRARVRPRQDLQEAGIEWASSWTPSSSR